MSLKSKIYVLSNIFLEINFYCTHDMTDVNQRYYIISLLKKFGMEGFKHVCTPFKNSNLNNNKVVVLDNNIPYQNLIGSLMYLDVCTRPDLYIAISYLIQFNSCYQEEHWKIAKCVLRYMKGTSDLGISFVGSEKNLVGFANADLGMTRLIANHTLVIILVLVSSSYHGSRKSKDLWLY